MKRLYTVTHHHRHGNSTYLVYCKDLPSEQEVIKYCKIDFEPDREEYIDIDYHANDEIIDIP